MTGNDYSIITESFRLSIIDFVALPPKNSLPTCMYKLIGISFIVLSSFRLIAYDGELLQNNTTNLYLDEVENCNGGGKNQSETVADTLQHVLKQMSTDYEYTVSGLTVHYANTNVSSPAVANILTYVWDLGDGTKTSEQTLEYTYPTMGSYRTCLTIVENASQKTVAQKCKNIEIIDADLCDITWDPVCGCDNQTYMNACFAENYHGVYYWIPGPCIGIEYALDCSFAYEGDDLTIQFINTSVGNYDSFSWDFGDGKTSEQRNPQYVYKQPGVYPVCLTIGSIITKKSLTFCQDIALVTSTEVPK